VERQWAPARAGWGNRRLHPHRFRSNGSGRGGRGGKHRFDLGFRLRCWAGERTGSGKGAFGQGLFQLDDGLAGVFVAGIGCLAIPHQRLVRILLHALTDLVAVGEIKLGKRVALLSGLAIEANGSFVIRSDALALLVERTQKKLRVSVATVGGLFEVVGGE